MAKKRKAVENGESTGRRDAKGKFTKGNPGRPKGTPNKVNAVLKDDILQAYSERGGVEWLRGLSDGEFPRLLQKIMPKEIAADIRTRADVSLEIDFAGMSTQELSRLGQATEDETCEIAGKTYVCEDPRGRLGLPLITALVDQIEGASRSDASPELPAGAAVYLLEASVALHERLPVLLELQARVGGALLALRHKDPNETPQGPKPPPKPRKTRKK